MVDQLPLEYCYQDFILDCQARKYRPSTLRFYRNQLPPFFAYLADQGVDQAGQVTAAHIRRHLTNLVDRGLKDTSIHAAARAIRRFLNFCVVEGYIVQAPKFAMPRLAKRIQPALTVEQAQAVVNACCTGRDRALILLALDTGLRVAELAALTVGDVDTKSGAVYVRSGKGAKDRMVHTGAKTRRALNRYLALRRNVRPTDPLWLSGRTGRALTRWGIRELCDRLSKAAGVQVSPHKLRRTAATLALRSGLPLPMVQQMLGHESLSTTEKYLALTDEDRRQAHEKFGAVDNLLE
jgi:integrase/recombinase XerC